MPVHIEVEEAAERVGPAFHVFTVRGVRLLFSLCTGSLVELSAQAFGVLRPLESETKGVLPAALGGFPPGVAGELAHRRA